MPAIIAVVAIAGVVMARSAWSGIRSGGRRARRRSFEATRPNADAVAGTEARERLDRLEHAIDAIAIEVERIGEGQRFLVKLLVDKPERKTESARP